MSTIINIRLLHRMTQSRLEILMYAQQTEREIMAVTLINVFIVPVEYEEKFLSTWKETTKFFSTTPNTGFIETHLHRNTGVGNSTFTFINIASWETAQHWKTAHDGYSPKEYLIPGVKGHPAIFECVADYFGVGKVDTGISFLRVPAKT